MNTKQNKKLCTLVFFGVMFQTMILSSYLIPINTTVVGCDGDHNHIDHNHIDSTIADVSNQHFDYFSLDTIQGFYLLFDSKLN
ncbi:MAG: hypothetical protein QXL17_04025 [Candidatus Thermoplasmatota archaeon]